MTGAGLFDFFVLLVGLAIIVGLIFAAMEFRPLPEPYRKFSRLAVGGAAFLLLVSAIGAVFFGRGGGGMPHVTPGNIIEFSIGVIVLYAILWLIDLALGYFGIPFADSIKFFLTIVALIVILTLAEVALIGGGLGIINLGQKHVGLTSDGGISYLPTAR